MTTIDYIGCLAIEFCFDMSERLGVELPETPLDLARKGERVQRVEVIPLIQVLTESAIVDVGHAQDLGASMASVRGQLVPILVRARESEGGVVYDVIDGFHRTEGKKRQGDLTIQANVVYGCSDEEMYDLRILAANSVKSVQFARLAEWMHSSFAQTPWADRITVTQAFQMGIFKRKGSRYEGIDTEDIAKIHDWVEGKARLWQRSISAIWTSLRLVDISAPDIVRDVRTASSGDERKRVTTQDKLKLVAGRFPGAENFEAQRAFIGYADQHRLGSEELHELLWRNASHIDVKTSKDEISAQITALEGQRVIQEKIAQNPDEPIEEELLEIETGQTDWFPEDELILPDRLNIPVNSHETDFSANCNVDGFAMPGELISIKRERLPNQNPEDLAAEVRMLREMLRIANEKLSKGAGEKALHFWESAPYLDSRERAVMTALLENLMPFDEIARKFEVTPRYLGILVQGVFVKKYMYSRGAQLQMENEALSDL